LITFDVDDTLITAVDVMANLEFPFWFKIRAAARYPDLLTNKTKMESLASLIFQQAECFIFDPNIIRLIQQIQQQESMVVALISMESGGLGIEFNEALGNVPLLLFNCIEAENPCLYKGILCANQETKGDVLGAFLDLYHLKPLQIIYI